MAARQCYVYVIKDGDAVLYVGKGSGRRRYQSAKRFNAAPDVLEWCATDDVAFERERYWIEQLKPTENKCPGGNGGRTKAVDPYALPKSLVRVVSAAEWKRSLIAMRKEFEEIERVGSQKYTARWLCSRLHVGNCEQYGVSKVKLDRLREVAHG